MNLPAYPKYKKSGVGILGDVPEHWDVKRLKFLGKSIIGLTYNPSDICNEAEGTLVLRASNIQNGQIIFSDNVYVSSPIPSNLTTRPGDILVCSRNGSRRLVGKSGKITKAEAGHSFGAFTTVFRSSHSDFMFYYFNSGLVSQQAGLFQTSTIYQLTTGILNEMWTTIPDQVEQQKIADFLDWKTGQIDALIAKKKLLIEKLKEKRLALITHAVTKGLNPNAKMKASGIPWLGDVPEHWEVRRLKMSARLTDKKVEADKENSMPYIGMENIESWTGKLLPLDADVVPSGVASMFLKCNTLFGKLRPYLAKACNPNFDGLCSTELLVIDSDDFDKRALLYLLLSEGFIDLVDSSTYGSKMPRANWDFVGNCLLPVPSLTEQQKIADFLDQNTKQIDALIAKNQQLIEKLTEYRTALITAATTGKIDVRGVEIKEGAD